jgi:hypothetical protein
MNKLLINYIKSYLKEATIPYKGRYISAKLQHELSPNISKDMTNLSDEAVLKTLMKNIDERTCISFVNKYNESIPKFNINPQAGYETPHGNYAYPLTLENLREVIASKKIKGAGFAIDRPYFLLFKVNSPNALIINKDGETNYKSIRSARRSMSRDKTITLDQDINTIIRNFVYYVRTSSNPSPKSQEWSTLDSDIYYRQQPFAYSKLEDKFEELLNKDITITNFANLFGTGLRNFLTKNSSLTHKNKVPSDIEKHFFDETFSLLKDFLVELSESEVNKFYKGEEETEDFHKVYFICWLLSQVGKISNRRKSNGPILTLLLRSIGLDAIIDQGSSTLHNAEPEQTVSLSFGNISAENIDFLGTFNNIFAKDSGYIEELAAKIYEEEGYKYDTDYFSKNENPISNIAGSDVYVFLEDLMISYSANDTILRRGIKVEGGKLKVCFDIYADEIKTDIDDISNLIVLIDDAILKSPHKDKIEIDLGVTVFEIEAKVDLLDVIKELLKTQDLKNFIKNRCKGTLSFSDIPNYESNVVLSCNRALSSYLGPYLKLSIDKSCSFTIKFEERFFLELILNIDDYFIIDKEAPLTFDLLNMKLFKPGSTKKHSNREEEKQKIIKQINEKYPKVKILI